MNEKNGGGRGVRRAGTLAVVAAAALMTAACGMVHVDFGSASSRATAPDGAAAFRANVAFAQCMQTHGMPDFPVPTSSNESFRINGSLKGGGNGKAGGPLARAYAACKHLQPPASAPSGNGVTQAQLDLVVKIAQCLRTHGQPDFPDPTVVNGSIHFTVQPGVLQSAQFQAAVKACRPLIPKGVRFP